MQQCHKRYLLNMIKISAVNFFSSQGKLHDRYGHIVALYAKYLCLKMEFNAKVGQTARKLFQLYMWKIIKQTPF